MAGDEVHYLAVSRSHGQEFPVRNWFTVFVDYGHVVCIGVCVDAGDDVAWFCCQDGSGPQSS
jgi:hypothetical protein